MLFFASGLRWVLTAVQKAAMAEMNDTTALRAALVEAGELLQSGEIDEAEYAQAEEELLARIREIRALNEQEAGPMTFTGLEASVVSDLDAAPPEAKPRQRKK